MSPRIAPLEEPCSEEVAELLASMMPPGMPPLRLFRTLARSPRLLRKLRAANLLDRGPLDRRDRELVILRTCARCGAEYEWGVHVAFFAKRVGLTDETVEATVLAPVGAEGPFGERDATLVALADELHDTSRIGEETWARLRAGWSDEQILELIVLAGFYHVISFVVGGVGVELEQGGGRFPAVIS